MGEITDKKTGKRGHLVSLIVDEASIPRQRAHIEQERRIALANFLDGNRLTVAGLSAGAYYGVMQLEGSRLILNLNDEQGARVQVSIELAKLTGLIKDYRIVCDNYYQAIADAPPSIIETLDVARRALHDDGARMISHNLAPDTHIDHETSRHLLTLVAAVLLRS